MTTQVWGPPGAGSLLALGAAGFAYSVHLSFLDEPLRGCPPSLDLGAQLIRVSLSMMFTFNTYIDRSDEASAVRVHLKSPPLKKHKQDLEIRTTKGRHATANSIRAVTTTWKARGRRTVPKAPLTPFPPDRRYTALQQRATGSWTTAQRIKHQPR